MSTPNPNTGMPTPQKKMKESFSQIMLTLSSNLSTLYAKLLVAAYISITAAWIVHFPEKSHQVQSHQFLCYLLLVSVLFFLYILCYLAQPNTDDLRIWPNHRSHGNAFLRQGAILFGLGTLVYSALEFISFFQVLPTSPCYDISHPIVFLFFSIFTILQVITIVRYPRLNIGKFPVLAKFGLMHLVTTNTIIWTHMVAKESMHEMMESEERELELEESEKAKEEILGGMSNISCSVNYWKKLVQEQKEACTEEKYFNNFLGGILINAAPFLFAFIIEFSLIGATVFYMAWSHVGLPYPESTANYIQKPNIRHYLSKIDWSHSFFGALLGILVSLINLFNLGVFFYIASVESSEDEFISDVTNTVINVISIITCSSGLIQIQKLERKHNDKENALKRFMLNLSGFFMYLYSCLKIGVGFNAKNIEKAPKVLIIINGIVEVVYVTLQITFLINLLKKHSKDNICKKSCHHAYDGCKPGRQAAMFLIFLNISQWAVATFQLQKNLASPWEEAFYGFLPWVILQRISLPLCVFFRFHSAAIAIDCWKNVYKPES